MDEAVDKLRLNFQERKDKMFSIFFFLLLVSLNLACISSEGLMDSEQCVSQREMAHKRYKEALNLYIVAGCYESDKLDNTFCRVIFQTLIGQGDRNSCNDDPQIPFPWYKRKKDQIQ